MLFDRQEGYCTYYATAMIVMLRHLGIPARMAAGFSQGDFDAGLGQYVVREEDAHTWVEAYFPGYGWIEFEPTSNEEPLKRDGDQQQPSQEQPVAPPPTPTVAASPTPPPTSTPEPSPTPEDQQQPPPDAPPTATSTPSPTPTATPLIVPTEPPPLTPPPPPDNSFLNYVMRALGIILAIVLVIVVLVLIVLIFYWWWEWRGMRGLSPISRAYARLERYIPLIGIVTRPEQTPEEKRGQIVEVFPVVERPVTTITDNYIRERYGLRDDTPQSTYDNDMANMAWSVTRRSIIGQWLRRLNPFYRRRDG